MVGLLPLEECILVRVQVRQQSSLVSMDLKGSDTEKILFRYCIPAERSIQRRKTTEDSVVFLFREE